MGKYAKLAEFIVEKVGGKENISSLTHCITRLRFRLVDEGKADDAALKASDGVVTVMKSGGQYQVVIGNHVADVYADVCMAAGITEDDSAETEQVKTGVFNRLIDIISGCFQPVLGALCAAGIVKGLNAVLLLLLGPDYGAGGTYLVLNAIGDSVFYFFPVLLGYSAARKFNVQPVIGMLLGAVMCYPSIQKSALEGAGEALGSLPLIGEYYTRFLGIPFVAGNYTSSVVPVLVIVAFAGLVQKKAKKYIPEVIQNFFVPFTVLIISIPVGLIVIGPVVSLITGILLQAFSSLYSISAVLTAMMVGIFWQVLVIFGLHWAIIPISLMNMTELGYDTVIAGSFGCAFATTAVIVAMMLKIKDKKRKAMAASAAISGICGVTEPAIYGFALPEKIPFFCSLVGSGVGGAILGLFGAKKYSMGGLGIFGIPNYLNPTGTGDSGLFGVLVGILAAAAVAFVLTLLFWKDHTEEAPEKKGKETVYSPVKGRVIPLSEVKDEAFSQEILGKGVAVQPECGEICAPFDGRIVTFFPTKHAIGLVSDHGCEILIHVGLDTVNLNGKYFKALAKEGERVKKGQKLLEFDMAQMKQEGYVLDTPVIVTNFDAYQNIAGSAGKNVNPGDELLTAEI